MRHFPDVFFGLFALGDVLKRSQHADWLTIFIKFDFAGDMADASDSISGDNAAI